MILFSRRNLHYSDYKWSVYPHNDPRVNGKPDTTQFDRAEGNEIEKLIHDTLPAEITEQEEVQKWIKVNLKF